MMITTMMKISLFVLAGTISGSSAHDHDDDWCRKFDNKPEACFDQHKELCIWVETDKKDRNKGKCWNRPIDPDYPSLSLEADVGVGVGDYLDQEDYYVVSKNIDYDDNDSALQQAAVTGAECDFGSNYTIYRISSDFCSFDVGIGIIRIFSETNTISSGDTTVTTETYSGDNVAIWKMGDKDSTLQCYSNVTFETLSTEYPNGSTFKVSTGDFAFGLDSNDTVADGVPLSSPGLYYFQGGRVEFWIDNDDIADFTKAEGDITDLCEVLGGGAAPAPTPPTTEASSRSYLRVN